MNSEAGSSGFTVNVVAVEGLPDEEGILVGLAEDPHRNENVLIFSRSFQPDDQDRRLGMDTYCLSVSTGATVYGGVIGWSIDGDVLSLVLNPRAASQLGVPEESHFRLNVDADTVSLLARALGTVFAVDASLAPGQPSD